jgi:hypothetical protein
MVEVEEEVEMLPMVLVEVEVGEVLEVLVQQLLLEQEEQVVLQDKLLF